MFVLVLICIAGWEDGESCLVQCIWSLVHALLMTWHAICAWYPLGWRLDYLTHNTSTAYLIITIPLHVCHMKVFVSHVEGCVEYVH